jgi:DNA-binding IclR family transcriptional regulator
LDNPEPERAGYVQVFGKIAAILDVLATSPSDLGLTQVATRTGLNKATTHRLLTTLLRHDYVEEGAQPGTYRLGLQLFRLGSAVHRRLDLRQRALPVMHDLAEATEETVSLCILRDDEALCIERVEGKHVQMLAMQVGTSLPLYIGAASRMLLASLPDDRVEAILSGELQQKTRYTEVSPARLREIVAQIRRQGYAISDENVTLGVVALSAPIRGIDEEVLGTLTISGIAQRLTRDRMPILITQVTNAAARISRNMGHPGAAGRR